MTRTYRTALNWDDEMRTNVSSMTAIESISEQKFSGLLDADGNRLMVVEEKSPAGFVVFAKVTE